MAEVLPNRANLEQEEVQAEAAASEGTMNKVAGSVNFWNTFFTGPRQFCANGFYNNGVAPETLVDGIVLAESDCEIYAISAWNYVAGVSGTTEFDIVCHPANGDPSYSIFSTTPKIPSTADHSPFACIGQRFEGVTSETLFQSTGTTLAALATPNVFKKGDRFTMTLVTKQVSAQNCGIQLSLRPANET